MDRETTSPFALQLFYRTGAFHRPDEFTSPDALPPSLTLNTWLDCTLSELAHHIAAAASSSSSSNTEYHQNLLPSPAIGTRLAFRLLFHDTRAATTSTPLSTTAKYTVKELGSVVIGDGGRGLDTEEPESEKTLSDTDPHKTLADARFVVGDYVSCAILPPLADGSVAPASSARMGRGMGVGEARVKVGRAPDGPGASFRKREGDWGNPAAAAATPFLVSRGEGRGRGGGGGGGSGRGGYEHFGSAARGARSHVPSGEWRRGEQLPEMPPGGRPARYRDRF
ncbi:hypothetical protein F4808DRAFT_196719 [Astrocystis sublimbata]|nr:hypothetical protein F4808DRAFT_196719 [Astrocystis sublimbata]